MKIVSIKRDSDWMAYLSGHGNLWEAGGTEEEAMGKLIKRLQEDYFCVILFE